MVFGAEGFRERLKLLFSEEWQEGTCILATKKATDNRSGIKEDTVEKFYPILVDYSSNLN